MLRLWSLTNPVCTRRLFLAVLAASMAVSAPVAAAQRGGPPMGHAQGVPPAGSPGGAPGAFGYSGGDMSRGRMGAPPASSADAGMNVSSMRAGLQLGPPGRWWDDKQFAKELKLRPDQQRKMDGVFDSNRSNLLKRLQDLEQEQNRMEALTRAKTLDEGALFAQIDRIAQARAELEKANTKLLLQLRAEMDQDQIVRLEQHR